MKKTRFGRSEKRLLSAAFALFFTAAAVYNFSVIMPESDIPHGELSADYSAKNNDDGLSELTPEEMVNKLNERFGGVLAEFNKAHGTELAFGSGGADNGSFFDEYDMLMSMSDDEFTEYLTAVLEGDSSSQGFKVEIMPFYFDENDSGDAEYYSERVIVGDNDTGDMFVLLDK